MPLTPLRMVGSSRAPEAAETPVNLDSPEEQKRRDVTRLLRLFARLAVPYLRLDQRARLDAAAVLGMTLLQNGVSVGLSFISRDFWSALNTKDITLFQHQALLFFLVLVACVPAVTYYGYVRDMAALRWRAWMTERVMTQYTSNRAFYDIDQDGSLDNPDQRLSSDLAAFTSDSLAFTLTILTSAIDIVSFSAILYSIYPLLFVVLLGYAASGTAATVWLGRSFVSLNRRQLVREADFRYALIRLRENAESIAFFHGESRELEGLSQRLQLALDNLSDLIGWQRNLGFLQTGYRYAVQVVPALVVSPRYFSGAIELGVVTQSFSAFSHIFNDLSLVVNRFDSLSQLGAQLGRIQEICDAVEAKLPPHARVFSLPNGNTDTNTASDPAVHRPSAFSTPEKIEYQAPLSHKGTGKIIMHESSEIALTLEHVTLCTPSQNNPRVLVRDLCITLPSGGSLLIVGPSGVGKSSLIRAIAGLWSSGTGVITRPHAKDVFFLPQKPYATLGTLRENLVYPQVVSDAPHDDRSATSRDAIPTDAQLLDVLQTVDLTDLPARMGGLDAMCDWGDTLSLGEQQRMSFARLLIAKPRMCVIDEGTSALPLDSEARLYNVLTELGITTVSIGHRPSLVKYHQNILRLGSENGSWSYEEIAQAQRDRVIAQVL